MSNLKEIFKEIANYNFFCNTIYDFYGCKIELRTNIQSQIEYCNNYYPRAELNVNCKVDWKVQIIQSNQLVDSLEKQSVNHKIIIKRSYECFGKTINIYYICDQEKLVSTMILPETDNDIDVFVMRFLREHLILSMIKQGWIMFHAAMIEKNGRGIAVIGNKNAGKTASMLKLIQNGRFHFVSNDKIMIRRTKMGDLEVISFPISMGIREKVYLLYQNIFKEYECTYDGNYINYKEKNNLLIEKKRYYSVDEIVKIMNTKYVNRTVLKAAYMPKFDSSADTCYIEKIMKQDFLDLIQQQVIDPKMKGYDFLYDKYGVYYDDINVKNIVKQVIKLDAYKITYNDKNKEEYVNLVQSLNSK